MWKDMDLQTDGGDGQVSSRSSGENVQMGQ